MLKGFTVTSSLIEDFCFTNLLLSLLFSFSFNFLVIVLVLKFLSYLYYLTCVSCCSFAGYHDA